jgi:hypothetical protein
MLHGWRFHLGPLGPGQSCSDGFPRSNDRGNVWNRHNPPASVGMSGRPGIGPRCPTWASCQVEDLHRPIPDRLPLKGFVDRNGLNKGCLPTQLGFDGLLQLSCRRFKHGCYRWVLSGE